MSQFKNLVFEGGRVKGIAYAGALEVLDAQTTLPDIRRVAGASAGARCYPTAFVPTFLRRAWDDR